MPQKKLLVVDSKVSLVAYEQAVNAEDDAARTLVPRHDTVIEENDHVIIFVPSKRMVREVEKLFQVRATFF